jgi:hypothetical protein
VKQNDAEKPNWKRKEKCDTKFFFPEEKFFYLRFKTKSVKQNDAKNLVGSGIKNAMQN